MKATRARKRQRAMEDHPDVYTKLPRYSGGTRHAFVGEEWVWKVPHDGWSITIAEQQNRREASFYAARKRGDYVSIPVAECYLLNCGTLKMRRVKTIGDLKKSPDGVFDGDLPMWVDSVDSRQIGIDDKGELVAYDV